MKQKGSETVGVAVRGLSALDFYSQISGPGIYQLFGVSCTTLRKWVKAGQLPELRYVEAHEPHWRLGELVALLEKQPRTRDAPRGAKGQVEPVNLKLESRKAQSIWERSRRSKPNQRILR